MVTSKRWAWLAALAVLVPLERAAGAQDPVVEEEMQYANPHLLVTTDWLVENLDDPKVRIVDAREPGDYAAGHIPGAVSVPRSATFDPKPPKSRVGPPAQIAKLFGAAGIDRKVHVVVYDGGKSTAAARVFWTLEYHGHPKVSVLDGGLTKWEAEELLVTRDAAEIEPVEFEVKLEAGRLSTKDEILAGLGKIAVVDARSSAEYTGARAVSARGGHVPGAVHVEWVRNFTDGEVPVFKSAKELTEMYVELGVTRDKPVHFY